MSRAALLFVFAPFAAFAQDVVAAPPPAANPLWLTALLGLAPVLIAAIVLLRPLLTLASWLHARALDQGRSALIKATFLATESLAKSVDHFLELTSADYADLLDPTKRAAALKHLEDQARSGALPAVTAALQALGSGWLTGAASQAIDAAAAKAPPVAVVAPGSTQKLTEALSPS